MMLEMGLYFRIQRDGKWQSVDLLHMTRGEILSLMGHGNYSPWTLLISVVEWIQDHYVGAVAGNNSSGATEDTDQVSTLLSQIASLPEWHEGRYGLDWCLHCNGIRPGQSIKFVGQAHIGHKEECLWVLAQRYVKMPKNRLGKVDADGDSGVGGV